VSAVKKFLVLAFYFAVVNGLVLLSIVWAVISVQRREFLTTAVVLGIALAFLGIEAALVITLMGKVTPRAELVAMETIIRPDRAVDAFIRWGTVAAVLAMAIYAVFAPLGKIDIPMSHGSREFFLIVAIGASLTGIANLWAIHKRGGASFLRLDPQGFEMGQGVSSVHGTWHDVTDITDQRPGKPTPLRGTLYMTLKDGRTRAQVVDSYTPGGDALRRLVRYYWINTDRRYELTDGRAIERLTELGTTS
jgi:hypothetical protein